jgi:hypothetical protein
MDYFPRKSLSKYLITDTIDFNKHVHDIDIFINDKWRKYAGGDIGRLFKITRWLELRFWPTRKRSQPSQGDFFTWITLQREPWSGAKHQNSKSFLKFSFLSYQDFLGLSQKLQNSLWLILMFQLYLNHQSFTVFAC